MKKVLMIIDMQEITVGKNHAKIFDYSSNLVSDINKYIDEFDKDNVIYIRNLMKDNIINKFAPIKCFKGTIESELVENLKIISDNIYDKYEGDAFSNEELRKYIESNKIDTIELVGVDGGGCISLTALGAIRHNCNVIINEKLIGTMFNNKKEKYFKKLRKLGVEFK